MADEVIERLVVQIESDIDELVKGTDKGVKKAEGSLKKFERTGKKAFAVLKTGALAFAAVITALIVGIGQLVQAAERGIAGVRIRRAFKNLAASAQQSSSEILSAMQAASDGTVSEMDLMRQANVALQLGVARTPEEFAKLTRSAIILGRAVGTGPVEAMELLINAAGRRSTEVLDNLGISLADVNSKMEEFAQRDFGKTTQQLDQVQRNALFMQATLEVADQKAKGLAGGIEDIGSSMEQARARTQEFRQDFDEASLVVVGKVSEVGQITFNVFFGPDGFFPLMEEGGNLLAEIFARILALWLGLSATIRSTISDIRKVIEGDLSISVLAPGELAERAAQKMAVAYKIALDDIKTDFAEVFDPEAGVIAPVDIIPPVVEPETIEETGQEATNALEHFTTEFLDLQERTNQEIEESEQEHKQNMLEITREAAEERKKAEEEALQDLSDLEEDTAKERADIIGQTRRDLTQVQKETDSDLARERESFQQDELRETEDHLRDLRRLRLSFLDNLEDAVTARDARRVRDLQRQFARETQERTEDFETKQGRDREDNQQRLAEIRENEAQRSAEIMAAQAEQLEALRIHEQERRQEINNSLAEQLAAINKAAAQAKIEESQSFIERQMELQTALQKRLEMVAKELSDENEITREGAQAILETLNQFYGVGGEIDTLLDDFDKRRKARTQAQQGFTNQQAVNQSLKAAAGILGSIPSFAQGGSMIATRPTLAMFGEAGPEMAQFTPMSQIGSSRPQRIQIELSGSAPPGIRGSDRDQIANVIVQAMREAGA